MSFLKAGVAAFIIMLFSCVPALADDHKATTNWYGEYFTDISDKSFDQLNDPVFLNPELKDPEFPDLTDRDQIWYYMFWNFYNKDVPLPGHVLVDATKKSTPVCKVATAIFTDLGKVDFRDHKDAYWSSPSWLTVINTYAQDAADTCPSWPKATQEFLKIRLDYDENPAGYQPPVQETPDTITVADLVLAASVSSSHSN